jgi:dihydroorotate dehydrogenase electron transfer subunit
MRYFQAKVAENRVLGGGYFVLRLAGCASLSTAKPGQFVMIRGAWGRDPLLPRAFSLLSVAPAAGTADILAKTVGRGTALLNGPCRGRVDARSLVPLPRGSNVWICWLPAGWGSPVHAGRAGGGAKTAALRLVSAAAVPPTSCPARVENMGLALHPTTEDGSVGMKGLVTRALEARLDTHRGKRVRVMGCGPNAMLWAVARLAREREVPCFISLEEQMACGIGVCLGCAIPARSRPYRYVCSNGPVFDAADVLDVNPHSRCPRRRPVPGVTRSDRP